MSRAWMALALVACCGCAGARTEVVAPTATVPISLSHAVRDGDGTLVPADRREVVGAFHDERTAWGMLYSVVKLTPTKDISSQVNGAVATSGGDAVVNLRVASKSCALNYFFPLTILPLWPGCTNVTVDGDIVHVRRDPPAPAAVASRSTP